MTDYLPALRPLLLPTHRPKLAAAYTFDALESTNQFLLIRPIAPDSSGLYTVCMAREQSHGRGRHGRIWLSPLGGVYLSVATVLTCTNSAWMYDLNLTTARSISRRFNRCFHINSIARPPNDLFCGEHKLCGILSEVSGSKLVIGVGMNLQPLPPEHQRKITAYPTVSLNELTPVPIPGDAVAAAIVDSIISSVESST